MSIEYLQVLQDAQARSLNAKYLPEQSPDISLFQAVVVAANTELAGVIAAPTETVATATISGNVSVGAATLFTSTGDNTVAQVYEVSIYTENQSLGMVGGTLGVTIRWSWNDAADTKAENIGTTQSLDNTAGEVWSNFLVTNIAADVGTTVTWEYAVTSWTSGSTPIRIVFKVRKLI